MPDNFTTQPCRYYFASVNSVGAPIPGTMHSKPNNQIDPGYTQCNEIRLTPYQMKPVAGQVQCFFKNGLRYFYQLNTLTKQIVPNSLIELKGKPAQMCVGTNQYLEYQIYN